MRKLTVGLLAVGLLMVAAPAMAQTADPLGLIASGAVLPFIGGNGSSSWLEVYSPVADNSGEGSGGVGGVHMFFHDTTCKRQGDSIGLPVTANGVAVIRVDNLISGLSQGLITLAGVDFTGFSLQPLENPIHATVLWVNASGINRVLEPISLNNPEAPQNPVTPSTVWNPLRSAAAFFAPAETAGGPLQTEIDLICPTAEITAVLPSPPFPELIPHPVAAQKNTLLGARIYDLVEDFVRNISSQCNCFTTFKNLAAIDPAYETDIRLSSGSYTEIESSLANGTPPCLPGGTSCPSFTGYRGIEVAGSAIGSTHGLDIFGRLHNGNRLVLQGETPPVGR
jgi:hypothetical protein